MAKKYNEVALAKLIRDGENLDGSKNQILSDFNSGVIADQKYKQGSKEYAAFMDNATEKEIIQRGRKIMDRRGYEYVLFGAVASIASSISSASDALALNETLTNGAAMKEAIKAAEAGDRVKLEMILTELYPTNNGLFKESLPNDVGVALGDANAARLFQVAIRESVDNAKRDWEDFAKELRERPLSYKRPRQWFDWGHW